MTAPSPETRRDILFLAVAGFFFCLWNLGGGSLASWDEAQYAQVAKEIVHSGDWVYLRFLGSDWYVKPPLAIWATAAFFTFFGIHEFAARLYSALCGVGTVLMTYIVGRFLFDRRTAVFGAGVLLSSTDFLHFSRWGMMDVPNLFFFTAAIAFFLRATRGERDDPAEGRTDGWFTAFALALAAAFMTKGPVIALVPVILVLTSLWTREWGYLKSRLFWLSFVLAAIFIFPWHVIAYLHNPDAFVNDYIGNHWFRRSAEAIEGHAAGWYFYIRTLINKFHPWVVLVPLALPFAIRSAVRGSKGMKLLTVWIAAVFLLFTFGISTKLRWYIMPMYPALALAIGALVARWIPDGGIPWAKLGFALVLALHFPFSHVMHIDYSAGIKAIAPAVKAAAGENEHVFLYEMHEQPAAVFYFDRTVRYVDSVPDLEKVMAESSKTVLVAPTERYTVETRALFESKGFKERMVTDTKDAVVLLEAIDG